MIILDLDDTIFPTESINPQLFDSSLSIIRQYFSKIYSNDEVKKVIANFWSEPIDHFLSVHHTPIEIINEFYCEISQINYSMLEIKTFPDYNEIKKIPIRKVLVTTGLKELQAAKIKALGIKNDFEGIYIDDPRLAPRNSKARIFEELLLGAQVHPQNIWIIGDNPNSEIQAGKKLGMRTIQRVSKDKARSNLADFRIQTFEELRSIIKV